jgi:hypothetical protein
VKGSVSPHLEQKNLGFNPRHGVRCVSEIYLRFVSCNKDAGDLICIV